MEKLQLGIAAALCACTAVLAGGCGSAFPAAGSPGKIQVAAAEDFWGSIAAQLGGEKVAVSSIVANPETDPHSFEPTAADGVTIARSQMAIVDGMGYDRWASELLAANPARGREVLDVGSLLGLGDGANPHQWYSPSAVQRVIGQIVADYKRLDPAAAAYFEQRHRAFITSGLAGYDRLQAEIRRRFVGVRVGYSESVFQPLGQSLGLRLITPYSFARAIAEGTDVSVQDKQTVDRQLETGAVHVWIYNSQNATPDVQRVTQLARARHVPVVAITETLSPASATFEQWQSAQLQRLASALHEATGR